MSQKDPNSDVKTKSLVDLFSAKVHHGPKFDQSEMNDIANYLKEIGDRKSGYDDRLSNDLRYELELFTAAQSNDSFRKALTLRRPLPQTPTRQDSLDGGLLLPVSRLCNAHITSPAYSFGYPLAEEVGSSVTFLRLPVDAVPSVLPTPSLLPSIHDLRTYSQLALPDEGELSLGLGLGRSPVIGGTLVYPASWEGPGADPLSPTGFSEVNQARASIGHFFACIPGAPLKQNTEMQVSVDVTVGPEGKQFFLCIPGNCILHVRGTANLVLLDSSGQEAQHRVPFVDWITWQEDTGLVSPIVSPVWEFALTRGLTIRPGTNWVYIGIEIFLEVSRLFAPPAPPADERTGFVMIDLRSPNHTTKGIHPIFNPRGPVRVPRIRLVFCPEQEFYLLESAVVLR